HVQHDVPVAVLEEVEQAESVALPDVPSERLYLVGERRGAVIHPALPDTGTIRAAQVHAQDTRGRDTGVVGQLPLPCALARRPAEAAGLELVADLLRRYAVEEDLQPVGLGVLDDPPAIEPDFACRPGRAPLEFLDPLPEPPDARVVGLEVVPESAPSEAERARHGVRRERLLVEVVGDPGLAHRLALLLVRETAAAHDRVGALHVRLESLGLGKLAACSLERIDVLLAGALDLPAHRVDRAVPPLDELARQPLDAFERLPVAVHGETRRPRDHRRRRAARCPEQFELALDIAATVPLQFVDEDAALLFGPRERGEVLIDGLNMADVLFLGLPGPALRREAVPPVGVVRDLVRDVVGRDANRQ